MASVPSASSPADPLKAPPPEASGWLFGLVRVAGRPLEQFLRIEAASGILLMAAAAIALAWANSPWAASYAKLWHLPVGVRFGPFTFERPLEWVVNDGLMVIFFFVVGLEIRREIDAGELSEPRRAALPAAAALGGMIVPAGLYLAFAGASDARSGWGIPMATDIAFAAGILTLLGKRVPAALRVLLLALAVIDDLGAIVVIALFYSDGISASGLLIAAGGFVGIVMMQRSGVRAKLLYVVPAVVAWAGVYRAGVHPTIAGVVVGLMTPVRAWLGSEGFVAGVRHDLAQLEATSAKSLSAHAVAGVLKHVNVARREALSPAESLIEALHPWVAFLIMPLFALANAGVVLEGSLSGASQLAASGIVVGLVFGKPIGVLLACALMLKLGFARLPAGVGWRELVVLGSVAGVGFTMSLFVAQLAFAEPSLLAPAKLSVLVASVLAGVLSFVVGRALLPLSVAANAARTADEAEASTEL